MSRFSYGGKKSILIITLNKWAKNIIFESGNSLTGY